MITEPEIALGDIRTGRVDLWCTVKKHDSRGVHFWVENGAWEGILHPSQRELTVCGDQGWSHPDAVVHKTNLLWQGKVPNPHSRDYNEAIQWLRDNAVAPRHAIFDKLPEQVFAIYVYLWAAQNSAKATMQQWWQVLTHLHEYELKIAKKPLPKKFVKDRWTDQEFEEDEIPF